MGVGRTLIKSHNRRTCCRNEQYFRLCEHDLCQGKQEILHWLPVCVESSRHCLGLMIIWVFRRDKNQKTETPNTISNEIDFGSSMEKSEQFTENYNSCIKLALSAPHRVRPRTDLHITAYHHMQWCVAHLNWNAER